MLHNGRVIAGLLQAPEATRQVFLRFEGLSDENVPLNIEVRRSGLDKAGMCDWQYELSMAIVGAGNIPINTWYRKHKRTEAVEALLSRMVAEICTQVTMSRGSKFAVTVLIGDSVAAVCYADKSSAEVYDFRL